MQTRGRSSYVTLNVVWLLAVVFAGFLAGMAFQSFGDSRAAADDEVFTCVKCGEVVTEQAVVLHTKCRSDEKRALGMSEAGKQLTKTLRAQMDQELSRGGQNSNHAGGRMERDSGGPKPE